MEKLFGFILLFIMSCLLNFCGETEDCHKTIRFRNNTDLTLYITASSDYPDTLFAYDANPILDPNLSKVLPNEINTDALSGKGRDCIETSFKYYVPSDTLLVFVFDAEVLENTAWDTVIANYMVLKRYKLSLDDFRSSNWTINFP